jgi:hypothetical protein
VTTGLANVLLERDVELAVLGRLLERVLRATVDRATPHGFTVLQARASQLEQGFTFGVARQLLERRAREAAPAEQKRLLAGVAEDARPALGLGGEQTDSGLRSMHGL